MPDATASGGEGRRGSGRVLSTAQHAFQALEIIAQNPRGIPIKALARRLNISLSSGYYLISSMREQGLAEVSPAGPGLYTLGPKVSLLYEGYVAATCQPERLTPVLEELRDRASARAYSARWSNGDLEVVQIRGRRGARELQEVTKGFRGAAHSLALGKLFLAQLPEEQWPATLHGPAYKRYTPATITSPTALRRHLLSVRERGVAFDVQEFTSGACCIAAPVRDGRNALVAALGISVPARRFEVEQRSLIRVIRDLAAEASMELGA
ncbi:MAG TPA: IclR family transcriptional regulator [Actinomycetota bacterium]|nr:IclR family transcriptional regulator [Actinomycetota bacterium]